MVQPRVSVITLSTADLARSRRFYAEGFGWAPVFEAEEILFYQLNGIVLGLYLDKEFATDMAASSASKSGGFSLAHNVREEAEVEPLMARLVEAGGSMQRSADAPPHGGLRGYVRDPDGHAWEIAYNAGFPIDSGGNVTFGVED